MHLFHVDLAHERHAERRRHPRPGPHPSDHPVRRGTARQLRRLAHIIEPGH